MNFFFKKFSLPLLCLALSSALWAQSITQILPAEPAKSNGSGPTDPLGRQTPNGTLFGFLQAMQVANYATATQYLQMSPARRASQGEEIATQLKTVLDSAFVGSLKAISNNHSIREILDYNRFIGAA